MGTGAPPKEKDKTPADGMEEHMDTKTPHAEQSERQILAAALQKGNLRHAEGLVPEDFLAVRDQRIFRTMRDFENRGEPLILDRLTAHLTKDKPEEEPEGMAAHLSTLYAEDVLDSNLPGCVAEIRNRAIERELRKKYMESLQPGGIGDETREGAGFPIPRGGFDFDLAAQYAAAKTDALDTFRQNAVRAGVRVFERFVEQGPVRPARDGERGQTENNENQECSGFHGTTFLLGFDRIL